MQYIFTNWDRISNPLQLVFQGSVFSSISIAILIPCPTPTHKWDDEFSNRVSIFRQILNPLINVLADVTKLSESDILQPSILNKIERSTMILSSLIYSIRSQPEVLRKIVFESCEAAFQSLFVVFPFLLSSSVSSAQSLNLLNCVLRITNFHLVSFDCLKRQLGSNYISSTVGQYISVFSRLNIIF